MAEARRRDEWDRTAMLCCLLANIHRDPKRRRKPFSVEDFHPLITAAERQQAKRRRVLPGSVQDLKALLRTRPQRKADG